MGIRFYCPNGHKLNVKSFLAGMRGICPHCGSRVNIPLQSTRPSSRQLRQQQADAARAGTPEQGSAGAGSVVASSGQAQVEPDAEFEVRLALPSDANGGTHVAAAGLPPQQAPGSASRSGEAPGGLAGQALDPLEEDPNASWYVIPPTGGQYGPASAPVMRTWLAEGRIGPDSLVWRAGWPDWKEARHVFPQVDLVDWSGGQPVITAPVVRELATPAAAVAESDADRGPARRSRHFEVTLVAILVGAVAVLAAVFLWVMYVAR